ncbi:AraC family transcriptional regulator [Nitrogeniibacter aestuarii]|uniref:AraC family transcriptional regulator n=1 Tax=Nitrogeniibacter aestuarii TaxID=2815343 RepID=UPI001D119B71|nr:helix-turn-helix domain-containing protein [Nitrogeniibacter aestuarii]
MSDVDVSSPFRYVAFHNPALERLGIELMSPARLRQRVDAGVMAQPERVDFFMLMLVSDGSGRHTVDFVDYPLGPGAVIFVRPGQVQRWHLEGDYGGMLALVSPVALPQNTAVGDARRERDLLLLDQWPTHAWLDGPGHARVGASAAGLEADFARYDGSERDVQLIRHELLVVMLQLAKCHAVTGAISESAGVTQGPYRLFVDALEQGFRAQHSLQYYAARLGYAASTLSRACLRMEGRSAKQVIDRRVTLEAQRLLAHADTPVATIGHELGFSEPTNFVKFFRRMTGVTPAAFRQRYTGDRHG